MFGLHAFISAHAARFVPPHKRAGTYLLYIITAARSIAFFAPLKFFVNIRTEKRRVCPAAPCSILFSDVHAVSAAQRLKAALIARADCAELPLAVVAVKLADNERRFD